VIHTPEEARSKWCPMVRRPLQSPTPIVVNRGGNDVVPGKDTCIAERCMMWVWRREGGAELRVGYCGLIRP